MAESFAMAWLPFLRSEGIKPEWEHRYEHLVSGEFRSSAALIRRKTQMKMKAMEEKWRSRKCMMLLN